MFVMKIVNLFNRSCELSGLQLQISEGSQSHYTPEEAKQLRQLVGDKLFNLSSFNCVRKGLLQLILNA